jgi:hypothetical protein
VPGKAEVNTNSGLGVQEAVERQISDSGSRTFASRSPSTMFNDDDAAAAAPETPYADDADGPIGCDWQVQGPVDLELCLP